QKELLANQAEIGLGATWGLVVGAVTDLWDNITALAELAWYLSPAGQLANSATDAIEYAKDPEAYKKKRQASDAETQALIAEISDVIGKALQDPGFLSEFGEELGEAAGRSAGHWFN